MAQPRRGEIWFVKLPTDPPDKNPRPVIIVSTDARNQHPRADTILAVPLSTTRTDLPFHVRLSPGETGLPETCEAQAENISVVRKVSLLPARTPLRRQTEGFIRNIARCVVLALGVNPANLS